VSEVIYGLWAGDGWAKDATGRIIWSERKRVIRMHLNDAVGGGWATDLCRVAEVGEDGRPVLNVPHVHLTATTPIGEDTPFLLGDATPEPLTHPDDVCSTLRGQWGGVG
jgi:hypothetical protein